MKNNTNVVLKAKKNLKEIYDGLSPSNQTKLREYVCVHLGIVRNTFMRRFKTGFDLVEEKIFYTWFTEQGISIEEVQQMVENA